MPTDPEHFKRKVDNGFKTTVTAKIIFKLTFFSFLIVFNFFACVSSSYNFSASIFSKEKTNEK